MSIKYSKLTLLLLVVVICSSASVSGSTQCVEKLLPCQPYLKGSVPVAPSCCVPLRQIVADEAECLCAVFNNQELLQSLNVTRQDGLNLAKSCGASSDPSMCDKIAAATPSASTLPSTPALPSTNNISTTTSPPPPERNAASVISYVGCVQSLAAIFSFILYAL
ncbi:Bifunctional inhibitor/lipid-transfer protein/seed storage 2S albumin superfamily protein [Striga hermonthica]|uniref:Bifunctional inhibitor/lipid-transfer protein/seed storage 2S albumin superfamily protein n=1 Tax=Striga hermonthica TaxID=68872 RepID=A0A9N7RGJ7_STRHE|nr:Bifunctional inhibitor/lipid-transfer protein/seed storage 2S albumin superfamily protein [Striga hermonthica]